jgi:hypothetical protein
MAGKRDDQLTPQELAVVRRLEAQYGRPLTIIIIEWPDRPSEVFPLVEIWVETQPPHHQCGWC